MIKILRICVIFFVFSLSFSACVTKKKKSETSAFGKFYHNTTAYYNGYWNANEIMKESMVTLRYSNVDNYNKILEIEDYVSLNNPKLVAADMDKAIDKVSTVAALHEPSEWVDDCYVLMAKAQYLKQDYETAEETLLYFEEDFNPSNPYGRNYEKKKLSKKATKKVREEEKKEKAKETATLKKQKEVVKAQAAKDKEQERKDKAKERQQLIKERQKQSKTRGRKPVVKKEEPAQVQDTSLMELKKEVANIPRTETKTIQTSNEKDESKLPDPVKKKTKEDKTAYSEGLLWLAKTHIKRQNWFGAESVLRKIETRDNLPEELQSEWLSTYANLYIKQKKYDLAIPKLIEAIEAVSQKQLKSRYSYIVGQIYQEMNYQDNALKYFDLARKYSKDFKMEFMASLAIAKTGLKTGKKSKESILDDLNKLLKEDKNSDVKYQIYYTMAEIELADNNKEKAIEFFRLSNSNNNVDENLRTEIFYTIANMHYNDEKYQEAKMYFDSTLMTLSNSDERISTIQRFVNNLAEIASSLEIIKYQDTLLYFAQLTGKEQEKAIAAYLESNQEKRQKDPVKSGIESKVNTARTNVNFGNSTFFAYNVTAKTKGKEDFLKTWGTRPLQDNWRKGRSSGSYIAASDIDVTETNPLEKSSEVTYNQEEYNAFLRELPTNPASKKEANDKITIAMFTLGKLFRDKIENYTKSAETLEKMHLRYGPTPYELDSYYYLYLDHSDLNNAGKATEYRNKILKKYPDSKYAMIISDPDYLVKSKGEFNKLEEYYKETYALFESGDYVSAASRVEQSYTMFGSENKYIPKFALLGAMCMGSKEGKDAYIKALSGVISSYPNTPEQTKAREIMRFLGGDNDAFKTVQIEDVDKIYTREDEKVHYVAVITYGLSESENVNVKVSISEYNKKHFKLDRLQLGDASLNREDNAQIILIRKFENSVKAMNYYNKVQKSGDEYVSVSGLNYDVFPITQANYRKMLSESSAAGYRIFFDKYYTSKRTDRK